MSFPLVPLRSFGEQRLARVLQFAHRLFTPRMLYLRPQRYAVVGASCMSIVEFTNPVRSVMPFGSCGHPNSPHFFDQAQLYSTHKFKPAWFSQDEIESHAKSKMELKR